MGRGRRGVEAWRGGVNRAARIENAIAWVSPAALEDNVPRRAVRSKAVLGACHGPLFLQLKDYS